MPSRSFAQPSRAIRAGRPYLPGAAQGWGQVRHGQDRPWPQPAFPHDALMSLQAVLLYFSHGALLLLLCFKECLLDFTANADQPFFRMSGAVPKIVCLCLKFARSFFG